MKKRILLIFSMSFLLMASKCEPKFWKTYKPVQDNVVGLSVNAFTEEKGFVENLSLGGEIFIDDTQEKFVNNKGSDSEVEALKTELSFGIGSIFKKSDIQTYDLKINGVTKTQIKDINNIMPNVDFIYGGLKADKVELDITQKPETTVDLDLSKYKDLIKDKIGVEINNIKAEKKGDKKYELRIENPNIFYSIQIASINETFGLSGNWIKKFNPTKNAPSTIVLNQGDKTKFIRPVYSKLWSGAKPNLEVWLKNDNGTLKVFYTPVNGTQKEIDLSSFYDNNSKDWTIRRELIYTYPLSSDVSKQIYLYVDAKDDNGMITINNNNSFIKYPERRLEIK
ncbi:hypothetical protein [Yeosuana marina]|uniref:hypothetical protein n=1 Tax=Yeosuana marina TaxID=1565536 RepID=UPI00141FB16E|nr:hypothetical protein [Yeosuana marina]